MERLHVDLTNKVAVVTGSSRGLGTAISLALAKKGATVIIHYRKKKKEAQSTLRKVCGYSAGSFSVSADLTREEEVQRMFEKIFKKKEKVDILVNLVGNFIYQPLSKTSFAQFRDVWESNLYSMLLCSQAVLPRMRKEKYGHIINFGSVGCERLILRPNTTPYYIAKCGVYLLTKMMAYEEAGYGIRINMISPGVLPTSMIKPQRFPAGRPAAFADILNAIFFLLSSKSSYIIGANIEISGGWSPEVEVGARS